MVNQVIYEEKNKTMDVYCKKVLSNPTVVSTIINFYCVEFKDCTVEEIREKYLCYDYQHTPLCLQGKTTKLYIKGDDYVEPDLRYKVMLPNTQGDYIYFNMEPQTLVGSLNELRSRNAYYLAAQIVVQKNDDFIGTKYLGLKKTYTGWFVILPTEHMKGVMLKEYPVLTSVNSNVPYTLSDEIRHYVESTYTFLGNPHDKRILKEQRFLSALLLPGMSLEERNKILLDYDIELIIEDEEMKETMDWYGAIMRQAEEREQKIYAQQKEREREIYAQQKEREQEIYAQQKEREQEKEVNQIIKMIEKFNLSIEEVLDTFDITKEERKRYKTLVESRMSF